MLRDGFGKACHFYEFSAVHIMIVNLFEYNYGLNRFAFELQQGKRSGIYTKYTKVRWNDKNHLHMSVIKMHEPMTAMKVITR